MGHLGATEQSFRSWLKLRWGRSFASFVEPSGGSTVGMPDVMLQFPGCELLLPVELKIGVDMTGKNAGRIRPRELRAEQIGWHDALARSGGKSCLLLGVPQGLKWKWRGRFIVYVQPRCNHAVLREWRKGWPIGKQFLGGLTRVTTSLNELDLDAWKTCMALGQSHPASQEAAELKKKTAG